MISWLLFNARSIDTEPTYVTERSSSLLDLVLVNNPHGILYSEVGPPLLDQTRYHMPTIGVLNHPIKSRLILLVNHGGCLSLQLLPCWEC
jgi:hypothetical protein